MFTLRNNKTRFIHMSSTDVFRYDLSVIPKRTLFINTLLNPLIKYRVRTTPLRHGTYKVKIKNVDNLLNNSGSVEGVLAIPEFRMFPRFTKYKYVSSHHVEFSWVTPVDGVPDEYVVYTNNGSGELDHNAEYTILDGTLNSAVLNLENNKDWLVKIEARKNGVTSRSKFIMSVKTPGESIPPPSPFDAQGEELVYEDENGDEVVITGEEDLNELPTTPSVLPSSYSGVTSRNVHIGKINFSFLWIYGDLADKFRLYHDSGTGEIDYTSYQEFSRVNSVMQDFTTEQIYYGFDDKIFTFVVRAVNQLGTEDTNKILHRVVLDGSAPNEIEDLTLGTNVL